MNDQVRVAPVVSVIMPAWNAMAFIHAAIESVLSQSFNDLELIIIDDGSTDGDYAALQTLDPRIQVVAGGRGGVSRARNLGLERSRGRYIAFIDADDLWVPGKLEAQVALLESDPEIAITFGPVLRWPAGEDGRFPDLSSQLPSPAELRQLNPEKRGWMYLQILMGSPLGMITPIMRREVYEQVGGFDVSLERAEDYEFWLRCSRLFKMQGSSAIQALYRIHSSSAMHRMIERNHLAELLENSRLRWGLQNPDGATLPLWRYRKRLGRAHFDHGYTHYWHGSASVASREFARSLANGCFVWRSATYWVLSQFKRLRHSTLAAV